MMRPHEEPEFGSEQLAEVWYVAQVQMAEQEPIQ